MSINNSDREFYYALFLKFYRNKLEEVLKIALCEIELDKNIDGRKVDIYAVAEDNREVFIELQLSLSDNVHLEQLTRIIENQDLNNIILVWVAINFKSTMLDAINEKINLSCKNIYFVALKMNEKIIDYLQVLNNIFITQVIENLKILNEVENQFKVKEIFYRIQDENNTAVYVKKTGETLELNSRQNVMKRILNELINLCGSS
jgi:hypothetical protein